MLATLPSQISLKLLQKHTHEILCYSLVFQQYTYTKHIEFLKLHRHRRSYIHISWHSEWANGSGLKIRSAMDNNTPTAYSINWIYSCCLCVGVQHLYKSINPEYLHCCLICVCIVYQARPKTISHSTILDCAVYVMLLIKCRGAYPPLVHRNAGVNSQDTHSNIITSLRSSEYVPFISMHWRHTLKMA